MILWFALLAAVSTVLPAAAANITVDSHGVLTRDGKPLRAIGVNVADAFWRMTETPGDNSYAADFAVLGKEGIPFARIAGTEFYPGWLAAYVRDKESYLKALDLVVHAAEKNNVGLVIDLFWFDSAVPDLVGEPRSAWGDPKSKTIALMQQYTRDVVARYKDSPALWVWEFGNEFNLQVDLPNAADFRPPINPGLGEPTKRSAKDDLRTAMVLNAFTIFARTVRELDPLHPITSGNSIPRNFAESMRKTLKWTKIDSRKSYQASLLLMNPDPMNMISMHLYPGELHQDRFANGNHASYRELLDLAMAAAKKAKKPLFVGEWGSSILDARNEAEVKKQFEALLSAIVDSGVPLAAFWQYTSSAFHGGDAWTARRDNAHAYMLDSIEAANARLETGN
jgi:hypothetical protein